MTYAFWDRKELYDLVWSQPVTKVAKQFGVSDVAIAKACRKLKVPLPGRGYWAKKVNGYAVHTVPLPKAKNIPQVSKPQPRVPGEKPPIDPEDQKRARSDRRLVVRRGITARASPLFEATSSRLSH